MSGDIRYNPKIVFLPQQAAEATQEYTEYLYGLRDENGIIGIPANLTDFDAKVLPVIPGTYNVICTLPGHGKTSWLNRLSRDHAQTIKDHRPDKGFAVMATTESLAESLTVFHAANALHFRVSSFRRGKLSDDQLRAIERWLMTERASFPLIIIGASFKHREDAIRLNIEAIGEAIRGVEQQTGKKCELVCLDYLQNLAASKGTSARNADNKTMQVIENSQAVKNYANWTGCPWWVGVQAKQEVAAYEIPIPLEQDAQWASQIGQDCDTFISGCRPMKYRKTGKKKFFESIQERFGINVENDLRPDGAYLFLLRVNKQREEGTGDIIPIFMDPAYNILDDWDQAAHRIQNRGQI